MRFDCEVTFPDRGFEFLLTYSHEETSHTTIDCISFHF
jgi:hypothetical protein